MAAKLELVPVRFTVPKYRCTRCSALMQDVAWRLSWTYGHGSRSVLYYDKIECLPKNRRAEAERLDIYGVAR